MNSPSVKIIECESVAVRCDDGEIFQFTVVDNKNLFSHFYRANKIGIPSPDFDYQLQCCCYNYALYKRHKNIVYLVCAWTTKEEINEPAMEIINTEERLHYLIK
ncbi:hypothetical protein [Pantoea ananatis]|uniref:hypothetical protein n=1 Tax=Pantoea ananas TaxID=553 RepID=UPI001140FA07|nr:hypothetical protein [Pantoea ananatis]